MTFLEQASQAITSAGGRMTNQRRLIIQLLANAREYLDAEGLYRRAQQEDDNISLATVYRTMNVLEEAGLVQQRYLSREHDRKYYEPVHGEAEYHFTCRGCGKVIAFKSDFMQQIKAQMEAEYGALVLSTCMCFDGYCAECRAQFDQE